MNMIQKNPHISVVICAFSLKRFENTVDCINSVFDNTYKNYDIILVIDGNEQLKQEMKEKFGEKDKVTIIGNEKDEGPSIARNRGIEIAKGDIIAFIDDDAYAPSDWLERIAKDFYDYPDIIVVGGKLLPIYANEYDELPEELLWIVGCTYKGHAENKQFVRNAISANMAVKRDIFDDIKFGYMHGMKNRLFVPIKQLEDTLLCVDINNKKVDAILYDPDIIIYHNVPTERLKIGYIIKRSFSEGILKAKLEEINIHNKNVLSSEYNYLNTVLISIIDNFSKFKIKDGVLTTLVVSSVLLGYISGMLQEKCQKMRFL